MGDYLRINKVFVPLIVPFILMCVWFGRMHWQILDTAETVEKIASQQSQYLLTQKEVEDLLCDVEDLQERLKQLEEFKYRGKSIKNLSVFFDENQLTTEGSLWQVP